MLLLASGAALTLATLALSYPYLPRRQNFAGRNIPTSAGLTFLPIILIMLVVSVAGLLPLGAGGVWYLAYSLLAAVVGFADDRWGGAGARGFAGHLGALSEGRLSTGLLKVVLLGGGAIIFGVLAFGGGWRAFVAALLLAGCANLANLFDVRPGRAFKFLGVPVVVLVLFLAPQGAVLAVAGVAGGAIALFYFDLRGRIMLGDAGAAIWGAVLGYLVVTSGPGAVWWVAGVATLGLTAVAEVSSISRVIEEVGTLRRLDLWGRGGDE